MCQCSLAHLQHPAANPKICDQTQEDPASLLFENVSQHFPLYGAVLCVLRSPSKTLAIEQRKASRTHEACETECIEIPTGLQQWSGSLALATPLHKTCWSACDANLWTLRVLCICSRYSHQPIQEFGLDTCAAEKEKAKTRQEKHCKTNETPVNLPKSDEQMASDCLLSQN